MVNHGMTINLRKALILGITGLFLWSICGGTVNVEGDIQDGFVKENGEYLIESGEQLELLSEMVANREEIEPGVDAATASYRLCNDVVVRDRLKIGSRRSPFLGDFNGDGYKIVGDDNFLIATEYRYDETGKQIRIEEYIRYDLVTEQPIYIDLEDWRTLEEAEHRLTSVPKESLYISVLNEELDLNETARRVKLCWDVNRHRNHYSVKIVDVPLRPTEDSDALVPFLDLFGEEAGAIMMQTAEGEDSYISFLRLEHVGGLDICTFAVRASEQEQYHVLVTGEWEDTEIEFQHLEIPATGSVGYSVLNCGISQVDINYDGQDDLLIKEGFSGGSGGTFGVYRAVVWDDTAEEFIWYPSFPTHLVFLEFNEKRMITQYRLGASHEAVCEYSWVDGEYAETREVVWESEPDGSAVLSYYEMGVLVRQHDVSGLDKNEYAEFYPDLAYWSLP